MKKTPLVFESLAFKQLQRVESFIKNINIYVMLCFVLTFGLVEL